ncbi:hypothetical protein BH10PSE17_BH10PSE17_19830 [soil metagenome]
MKSSEQLRELFGARKMVILLLVLTAPVWIVVLVSVVLVAQSRFSDDSLRVLDLKSLGESGPSVRLIATDEKTLGVRTYALYLDPVVHDGGAIDPVLLTYGAPEDGYGQQPSLTLDQDRLIVTDPGLQWVSYRRHSVVGVDRVFDIVAVRGQQAAQE